MSTSSQQVWTPDVTPRMVEAVISDPDAWDYIAKAAVEQRDTHEFGSRGWSLLNRLFLVAAEIAESGACAQSVLDTRPRRDGDGL